MSGILITTAHSPTKPEALNHAHVAWWNNWLITIFSGKNPYLLVMFANVLAPYSFSPAASLEKKWGLIDIFAVHVI